MKNKKTVLVSLLLVVAGFVAAMSFYQNDVDSKNSALATSSNKGIPFVRDYSPSFGQNKNKVIITEFLDPECESCGAFHPIIKEVFNDYQIETQLVIRYLDNHQNSKYAVRVLEASRLQNKFKETLDVMFKYQSKWADHYNPKPKLLWTILPEAGLDMEKLRADFERNNIDDILKFDRMDATTLGVRGTPTFFVNGKKLRELSHKALQDLVESEIYK